MKKRLLIFCLLSILLLSACNVVKINYPPTAVKTVPDESSELQTRVPQILTAAATQGIKAAVPGNVVTTEPKGPIGGEPTEQPTAVPPTLAPTATPIIEPSPTPAPTLEPTLAPTATEVPVQTATIIPTAVYANVTPIAATTEDPRTRLGPPTSGDPMDNSSFWTWPTGYDRYTSADWRGGAMRMSALTQTAGWRLPLVGPTPNFYLEMTARPETCTGKDNYGLYFRIPVQRQPDQGYWFVISCDGFYRLAKWDGKVAPKGEYTALINWTASKYIRQGAGQPNRVGILAQGSKISLYINGYYLTSYSDASFASGYFGVLVNGKETTGFSINVDEMAYWNNPQ